MSKKLAVVEGTKSYDGFVEPEHKVGEHIDVIATGDEFNVEIPNLKPAQSYEQGEFYVCKVDDEGNLLGGLVAIPAFTTKPVQETPKNVEVTPNDNGGASAKAE